MTVDATSDVSYLILASGSTVVDTAVTAPAMPTMSVATCTATLTLEVHDGSMWTNYETMGASQPAWIANFNASTKAFNVSSADKTLAG